MYSSLGSLGICFLTFSERQIQFEHFSFYAWRFADWNLYTKSIWIPFFTHRLDKMLKFSIWTCLLEKHNIKCFKNAIWYPWHASISAYMCSQNYGCSLGKIESFYVKIRYDEPWNYNIQTVFATKVFFTWRSNCCGNNNK